MYLEHLHAAVLQDIARAALGGEPDAGEASTDLGMETLEHLRECSVCQGRLAATSAALDCLSEDATADAAPDREPTRRPLDDLEESLADYIVVDLEPCGVERSDLADPAVRIAASTSAITSIGAARERTRAFRSTDGRLEVDVREDTRDDACYVYLLPRAGLDRESVRLCMPAGARPALARKVLFEDRKHFESLVEQLSAIAGSEFDASFAFSDR